MNSLAISYFVAGVLFSGGTAVKPTYPELGHTLQATGAGTFIGASAGALVPSHNDRTVMTGAFAGGATSAATAKLFVFKW